MSLAKEWHEIRLWYSGKQSQNALFAFKKIQLLKVMDENRIGYFLVLDEPEFALVRIEGSKDLATQVMKSIESLDSDQFSHLTMETWSPERDARDRILSSRERAGLPKSAAGWKITGMDQSGRWQWVPEDLNRQQAAFALFMTRVAGRLTRAYLEEMPYRVEDRWMMSLFLHLLLDSISTWQLEEDESRKFPYL
jgi:hypothetical protein